MPYRFTTRAQVEGPAIPSTSFEAAGVVNKTGVVLDRFDGYALRGRINGRGALSWSGNQAWNFDVDAQGLAIGELRPGVEGRVSAKGNIAGAGLSAAAPWTARLTSLSGTMFGRPLTGRGEIAHRNGLFDLRGRTHCEWHLLRRPQRPRRHQRAGPGLERRPAFAGRRPAWHDWHARLARLGTRLAAPSRPCRHRARAAFRLRRRADCELRRRG